MHLKIMIGDAEFTGPADWSDYHGLTAELSGFTERISRSAESKNHLFVVIDGTENALLLNVHIRPRAQSWAVGQPIKELIHVSASRMVRGLPFDMQEMPAVQSWRFTSPALALWYGEDNAKIEVTRGEVVARFKTKIDAFDLGDGVATVERGITSPGFPNYGEYNFKTPIYFQFKPNDPVDIDTCFEDIWKTLCYFDLLAGFPSGPAECWLGILGSERTFTSHIAQHYLSSEKEEVKNHPYRVFIRRAQHDIKDSLPTYRRQFEKIKLIQWTARYLNRTSLNFPEGFLTACNLIEFLGKAAVSSRSSWPGDIEAICGALSEETELRKKFDRMAKSLLLGPSFADRYKFVASYLSGFGISLAMPHKRVQSVRGKYRHEINKIDQADMDVMGAVVLLASFAGLVWTCEQAGIKAEDISRSADNIAFHQEFGTGARLWGGPAPARG